jgi:uncharacterized protein
MTAPVITGLYTALLMLLMLALAANVVRWRLKAKVSLGDGGHRELTAAIRCHGNATEYVPLVVIGLALAEMLGAPTTAIHLYGGLFFIGRILHALGMSQQKVVNKARQLGIVLSWLVMLALPLHLIMLTL